MSQLRQHLRFTWQNRFRVIKEKFRLGFLGQNVHIDKCVEFMRFPKNIFVQDEVVIKEGAKICSCNNQAKIKIGERSTVGYHTCFFASEYIENDHYCLISPVLYKETATIKSLKLDISTNNRTNQALIKNNSHG